MVKGAGREQMAHLIEEMSHDDRANLLRELPVPVRESLLRLVDEADRRDIAKLIQYPENTAGALMTTDYAWLPHNITVEDALERLRLQAPDSETIYYVYIVDDQRRLLGVVSLRDLILHPRPTPLVGVHGDEGRSRSRTPTTARRWPRLFGEYDLLAMPVVDADGRLVGIITSDDVLDVVVEQATEDVHRMGAVGPMEESYLEAGFFKLWRNRAFWLSCLFGAELFTFTALSAFEESIAQVVVLSLFVPLCISTGGNSGSQAATLITRALALGEVTGRDWLRVFRHEIVMGVVLGLTLGVIGFVRASLTPESVRSSSPPRMESFEVPRPRRRAAARSREEKERGLLRAVRRGEGGHGRRCRRRQPVADPAQPRPRSSCPRTTSCPTPTTRRGGNLVYQLPGEMHAARRAGAALGPGPGHRHLGGGHLPVGHADRLDAAADLQAPRRRSGHRFQPVRRDVRGRDGHRHLLQRRADDPGEVPGVVAELRLGTKVSITALGRVTISCQAGARHEGPACHFRTGSRVAARASRKRSTPKTASTAKLQPKRTRTSRWCSRRTASGRTRPACTAP